MKQIKTIKNRIDAAEAFDTAVNAALVEGWTLTRRDVIRPNAHPVGETSFTMLYAELELDIEKRCDNCKHADKRPDDKPCDSCDSQFCKWEAAKE